MIWNPKYECMDREELKALQLSRLQETVDRCYRCVPFFKHRLDEAGVTPGSIRSLEDIKRIPFTTKADMRDNYPFGLFAVPKKELARIHSSSGTTGKPTVVGYTKKDMNTWSEACARFITAAGVTSEDVIQISFGYGLFTGGFGLHYGMEKVGASVIPVSSGNTARQIMIMKDYGVTGLVATPSYAMHIAECIHEAGLNPEKDLSLKYGLFGSEASSKEMRNQLEQQFGGILVTDNYGLSEVIGPGISGECEQKNGMHISEDLFYVEIIDPNTLETLPMGETGEVVITTLTKEATPMLRYRTRDISRLLPPGCPCGRTNMRMANVTGRTDDMLIIRGVNVFPSQIETVLVEADGVEPHYLLVVNRKGALDELEVWVELSEKTFSDQIKKLEELNKTIQHAIHTTVGITCKVKLVEPKTIQRSEGKATRVVDNRPKE